MRPGSDRLIQEGTCTTPTGEQLSVIVNDRRGAGKSGLRMFAGLVSDPFIFQFPWILETLKTGRIASPEGRKNTMDGLNALALVLEIDCHQWLDGGSLFAVVGETLAMAKRPVRLERVGRPEIKNIAMQWNPEYASVGVSEAEARATLDCVVARHDYRLLTRAVVNGRTEGFCKLIADRKSGVVVGAHVLGEYSAEVIQVAAVCMAAKMTVLQIAELQFAYPTFTQAIGLAALQLARELGLLARAEAFDSAELSFVSGPEAG